MDKYKVTPNRFPCDRTSCVPEQRSTTIQPFTIKPKTFKAQTIKLKPIRTP